MFGETLRKKRVLFKSFHECVGGVSHYSACNSGCYIPKTGVVPSMVRGPKKSNAIGRSSYLSVGLIELCMDKSLDVFSLLLPSRDNSRQCERHTCFTMIPPRLWQTKISGRSGLTYAEISAIHRIGLCSITFRLVFNRFSRFSACSDTPAIEV
jgi:hypothetical protein